MKKEIKQKENQIPFAISVLQEKISREFDLSIDEVKNKIITIVDGELTITDKK